MRVPLVLALALLVPPRSAAAQRLAPPLFPSIEVPGIETGLESRGSGGLRGEEASEGSVIFGSIIGGLGAMCVGAVVGSRLADTPCEDCGLIEGLYGAAIGFGLGASGGAHLANHEEGPFGKSALTTMAIGAAGVFTAAATEQWEILLAVPIVQVAGAVAIERGHERE
jgi:hypothetical protein